ncbi:hypothetical protein MBLNU459_g6315t1 [Dothideomycetes sp. NU459]
MTDAPLTLFAPAARQQHSESTSPVPPSLVPPPRSRGPPTLDGNVEEDDGEITCICAYAHDDGYSVQCEACNRWQHMICYYPSPEDEPVGDQHHYCIDCKPREIDARKATERQRRKLEQQSLQNGLKRPTTSKGHRKKAKESPQAHAAVNGWSADKHALLHGRDRKSASPRDQPPPAKRPKTSHRPSNSVSQVQRRRNGSTAHNHQRSSSKSPGPLGPIMPLYTEEFLHLYDSSESHVETETNLMNNIAVTNSLSEWIKNPEAVEKDTNGRTQNEVFLRWDGRFEDMPGRPPVALHWEQDPKLADTDTPARWACLTVQEEISERTFIGELRGHIGYQEDYKNDPESRWPSMRHAEPFVFFHPQLPIYIDARQEGSIFRYVRRSCQPNAEMSTIITDGTNYHFCFMATKDISPGDEVTIAWNTDDNLRTMYIERSGSGNHGPDIMNHISMWVSSVLANCGPCACRGDTCLMDRFDRRGKPMPVEAVHVPLKAPRQRKKKTSHQVSPDDQGRNSNSRSGSEVRKMDHDDDMTDSRSVSGSYRGSGSRDITPNTHYSAILPEMSEREKKKLMREEEMFRRQEEESGRQKKKRHSGGSNLNTPSATTSKQLGHASNSSSSRYADAGTSQSRSHATSGRTASAKRVARNGPPSSRSIGLSSSGSKPPRPAYVDMAIQCDLDSEEQPTMPPSPPRKPKQYLSVTQRLLRRCASNNLKRKAETQDEPLQDEPGKVEPVKDEQRPAEERQGDTMDIDKDESPKPDAETADVLPLSPVSTKATDADMVDVVPSAPLSPAFGPPEVAMKDDDDEDEAVNASSPPNDLDSAETHPDSSPVTENASITSHPPMDPPPPPWPSKLEQAPTVIADTQPSSPEGTTHSKRPDFHVTLPPILLNSLSTSSSGSAAPDGMTMAQSPSALTPSFSGGSLFSPSVTAAVNPSPARKKMSLSDYTKRSKATKVEPGLTAREVSPANSVSADTLPVVKDKDTVLQGSAVIDSPAPETAPSSSAGSVPNLEPITEQKEEGSAEAVAEC